MKPKTRSAAGVRPRRKAALLATAFTLAVLYAADVVARSHPFGRRTRSGLLRTAAARLYHRLVNRLVDVELVDGVGDFRLLSRRVVDAVLDLTEYNHFSKGLFARVGFPGTTFEYENAARRHGRSSWSFRSLLNYGLDGLPSFNNRPLPAALHLGLWLLVCTGLHAAWIVGDDSSTTWRRRAMSPSSWP